MRDSTRRLGYSQRTLTRACIAATRRTAKQVIDGRILLEAQRLPVDGEPPVSSVAAHLGFTEPGNFSEFVLRITGESSANRQHRNHPSNPPTPPEG